VFVIYVVVHRQSRNEAGYTDRVGHFSISTVFKEGRVNLQSLNEVGYIDRLCLAS
jgi:hypothetical protein